MHPRNHPDSLLIYENARILIIINTDSINEMKCINETLAMKRWQRLSWPRAAASW